MKRTLAWILLFAAFFSLAACGNSTAPAPATTEAPVMEQTPLPATTPTSTPESEPEPAVLAPYGISLWDSVEDADLTALLSGHSRENLLQYVENFETIEDESYEHKGSYPLSTKTHVETVFYLDGERYVENAETSSTLSTINNSRIAIYNLADKDQSVSYQKDSRGLLEWPIDKEEVDSVVKGCILPLSTVEFRIEDLARYAVEGHYVFTFRLSPLVESEDGTTTEYTDCMLEVDPETSLIVRYGYTEHFVRLEDGETKDASGKSYLLSKGEDTSIVSGEISYNVDRQPDYSLLP